MLMVFKTPERYLVATKTQGWMQMLQMCDVCAYHTYSKEVWMIKDRFTGRTGVISELEFLEIIDISKFLDNEVYNDVYTPAEEIPDETVNSYVRDISSAYSRAKERAKQERMSYEHRRVE